MRGKTLVAILLAAAFGLTGCAKKTINSTTETKTISESIGSQNELKTEYMVLKDGKYVGHRWNLIYPNGVQLDAIDVGNDGKLDTVLVTANPNNIYIIRGPSPNREMMIIPNKEEFGNYLMPKESIIKYQNINNIIKH